MEACVRGFSYMPTNKVEVTDLQYIEGEELERTWKASRRQRAKEQEQKIWDEFVKEQNSVASAFQEDPYQFLHELPENCLKELMESELQKMKKEAELVAAEQAKQGEGDSQMDKSGHVTFEEDKECDIFHIFDDENDENDDNNENDEESGPEDEGLNDTGSSPRTVRERISDVEDPEPPEKHSSEQYLNKSSDDVRNLVENSINLARIQDLRTKISNHLYDIMTSLETQNVGMMEEEQIVRACRRAAEFSSRFNRIYIYQIHRAMHDIKRNTKNVLPFAKHTHFQAQMLRIVSLHQSMLHAVQAFLKSLEQTCCFRESATALQALLSMFRSASQLCSDTPAPNDFAAAAELYKDELLVTCDKMENTILEYSNRISHFLETEPPSSSSRKTKVPRGKGKRGQTTLTTNTVSKSNMDSRLSMYSLETFRNCNGKTSSRDMQSSGCTSKLRVTSSRENPLESIEKSKKRTLGSRRPLMRAPSARGRRGMTARDTEITTMVEGVEACASSHVSQGGSPRGTPRKGRKAGSGVRKPPTTNHDRVRNMSPKSKTRGITKPSVILKALSSINSEGTSLNQLKLSVPKLHFNEQEGDPQTDRDGKRQSKDSNRSASQRSGNSKALETTPRRGKDRPISPRSLNAKDLEYSKGVMKSGSNSRDQNNEKASYSPKEGHRDSARDSARDVVTGHHRREGMEESGRNGIGSPGKEEGYIKDKSCRDDNDIERLKGLSNTPARCEVTRLLQQLCSGDSKSSGRNERGSGAKNAQLLCITSNSSPRQPSTPQLLRILEETIQKKAPKPMFPTPTPARDPDRFRLMFNISEKTASKLFQYRTAFVQHMLASPMYANSAVGKPWEMIGNVSEKIIEEALLKCAKDMQIQDIVQELYRCETN